MLDRAIAIFGLALALIIGLWTFAPEGWPKIPPWITASGIGLGILLLGFGAGLIVADLRNDDPTKASSKPEFHIALSGANVFIPDLMPDVTGIAIDARIWNTGAPSIVTKWSMKIIPNGAPPVVAQLTAMPNVLTAIGPFNSTKLLASNSLEIKVRETQVSLTPISGVLLFYVSLPKTLVQANETNWEITAEDIYGKETKVVQLVGDWLQR